MKMFISGTAGFGTKAVTELNDQVQGYLDYCMEKNYQMLIGDCIGIDTLVQEYLNSKGYDNVVVYCSGFRCRNIVNCQWKVKKVPNLVGASGRDFFALKDKAMAQDADCALAIWDGKSKGTGTNIANMQKQDKPVTVFRTDENRFVRF